MKRRVLIWLIDRLRGPLQVGVYDFHTIGPECFGIGWPDDFPEEHGYPTHICFRGETYIPLKPTPRTRLHNRLVSVANKEKTS